MFNRKTKMIENEEFGLVSVIMAAYNAEKTIVQAIASVLGQTYSKLELIVINDGSNDQTSAMVKNFIDKDKRVRLIENSVNSGVSKSRSIGFQMAEGEWIAILDSDDIWVAEKIEKQISLQKKRDAEFIFTGSAFIDRNGHFKNWILHVPKEVTYQYLLKQNIISNSSVLVKKELLHSFWICNDEMHEDFACWINILRSGRKAYGIDEPLLIYRISPASKSGNKFKAAKMNWNTYRTVGLNTLEAGYYMARYIINAMLKYKNLI